MAVEKGSARNSYETFLCSKRQYADGNGFEPIWIPDSLFDFQKHLVHWAIRRGRAGLFEDCGLGKSPQELVWAENVVRYTNKPVLLLTPLSVGKQMLREADKFGVDAVRSLDGKFTGKRVVIANYERLHLFNADDFSGVVCDESSCLKDFSSKRKAAVTEFMRTRPYRLLCTATAAPNDYPELGTSSEALGELGYQDMLSRFFKQEVAGGHHAWGRLKYRLRSHAETDFWRWVCSWSRAVRKPSDLGYEDGAFDLPPLELNEHIVEEDGGHAGRLFPVEAITMEEQRDEGKRTLVARCEKVAELLSGSNEPSVSWCHLNPEGDLLKKLIPNSVQVSGSDSDEEKEEAFEAFQSGQIQNMVSKPSIAGFGLNWQHCARQTYFPSHSFEAYFQAVRRCWRFGQKRTVRVDLVTTNGQSRVKANLQRKSDAASFAFAKLVALMNESMKVDRMPYGDLPARTPTWLSA